VSAEHDADNAHAAALTKATANAGYLSAMQK
jgi:hypothetical protein